MFDVHVIMRDDVPVYAVLGTKEFAREKMLQLQDRFGNNGAEHFGRDPFRWHIETVSGE